MIQKFVSKLIDILGYKVLKKTYYDNYIQIDKLINPPWNSDCFKNIYNKIKNNTVVSPDRCYILMNFASLCLNYEGDFAECGTYKGGTAYLIANLIDSAGKQKVLHLFDTFTGMPVFADPKRDNHKPGDFGDTSLSSVKMFLQKFKFINYHVGIIPNTFNDVENSYFSFVHIDVDLYPSTLACCQFFYPRLVKGGVLICDDYGFKGYERAAKLAIDDFFKDKPEKVIYLPTGQAIVIKI